VESVRGATGHQPALDGLRGLAIAAVLVCHLSSLLNPTNVPSDLAAVLGYGWVGVDLFFALSGFLITRILLRSKGRPMYLQAFWARRILRIMPLYFVVLVTVLAAGTLVPALGAALPPAADRPLYFVFLSNWLSALHPWSPNIVWHFWSLAVEEQFYLAWPFCVLFLSRRNLAILCAALAIVALFLRVRYVVGFGPAPMLSFLTATRGDALALGALAAVLSSGAAPAGALRVRLASGLAVSGLAAFCIGLFAFWSQRREFYQTAGFSLLAVGFAASVFAVAAARSRPWPIRVLESRPLVRLGIYSYGIYLIHVPLLEAYQRVLLVRLPPFWHAGLAPAAAGIVAVWTLTYYLAKFVFERFEAPILSLKRYVSAPASTVAFEAAAK
jgi:peptidoglycan/LPS O-acetylase OafA/YrhL